MSPHYSPFVWRALRELLCAAPAQIGLTIGVPQDTTRIACTAATCDGHEATVDGDTTCEAATLRDTRRCLGGVQMRGGPTGGAHPCLAMSMTSIVTMNLPMLSRRRRCGSAALSTMMTMCRGAQQQRTAIRAL